jgi:hypothetical protein
MSYLASRARVVRLFLVDMAMLASLVFAAHNILLDR